MGSLDGIWAWRATFRFAAATRLTYERTSVLDFQLWQRYVPGALSSAKSAVIAERDEDLRYAVDCHLRALELLEAFDGKMNWSPHRPRRVRSGFGEPSDYGLLLEAIEAHKAATKRILRRI